MTISANDRRKEYAGNGITTQFTGPRAFSASHIAVYEVDDATQVATLQTGYTLTNVGVRNRQTVVTMAAAPTSGKTLLILRTVPYEQDTDITNQGAYLPQVVEDAMDKLSQQIQQLWDAVSRSFRAQDTAAAVGAIGNTPNRYVVTDANGNPALADSPPSADLTLRGDLATTSSDKGGFLVRFVQDAVDAVARWITDKLREDVSVKDFGAVGDGVTDDTLAIQKAINRRAGGSRSGSLIFPDGTYLVNGATLTAPGPISMQAKARSTAWLKRTVAGNLLQVGTCKIQGIDFMHEGPSGSTVVSTSDDLHLIGCVFRPGAANADPICVLKHANINMDACQFTTTHASQWCVDVVADTGNFCINGTIGGQTTMYGIGNGVRFRTGTGGRPEGWAVENCRIILTGATSVEVQSCLSIDVTGCTLDQSSGYGVKLVPAGSGIDALTIDDNYIATASNPATGIGIGATAGAGGIRHLSITNNHFELCGTACVLDSQMSGVRYCDNTSDNITTRHLDYAGAAGVAIDANFFRGAVNLLRLVDGATGSAISVTGNNLDPLGSITYTPTDPTRFEFSANTGKKFSGWGSAISPAIAAGTSSFMNVPHGLAITPPVSKVVAQLATASGGFQNPTANVVAIDATNVTLEMFYTVVAAGTLRGTVFCSG